MERAFRYGELLKTDSDAAELFAKSKKKFETYNAKINTELKETESLILTARDSAVSAKERAVFSGCFMITRSISTKRIRFISNKQSQFFQ